MTDTDIRKKKLACPSHKRVTRCFISKTFFLTKRIVTNRTYCD